MYLKTLFAFAIVLLAFQLAAGEMYQWVDQNGVVTFKDTPPPPSKKKKQVKVYSDDDFAPAPQQRTEPRRTEPRRRELLLVGAAKADAPAKAKAGRFNGTVEMYVTDWCRYCKQAQSYLTSKGIPYVAYNIEKDPAAGKRHKELGGRGVPLIIIGSKKMSGFSPEAFEYYMNNSK